MRSIYSAPIRVYLCLFTLALVGIYAAIRLPISLFPAAAKPEVRIWMPSYSFTPQTFLKEVGYDLESALSAINQKGASAQKVKADFWTGGFFYVIDFNWGDDPEEAKRQVIETVSRFSQRLPAMMRDDIEVFMRGQGSELTLSLYAPELTTDAIRRKVQRPLSTQLAALHEVGSNYIWDPQVMATQIELDPQAMALNHLLPRQVIEKIRSQPRESYRAGVFLNKGQRTPIQIPTFIQNADDLPRIWLKNQNGKDVRLDQIGRVFYRANDKNGVFRTSTHEAVIVNATPSASANIRDMAGKVLAMIQKTVAEIDDRIQCLTLINPKEMIDAAIANVAKEVLLSAALAVMVLMLFLGSLRQTITCAIEIPLSIIFSFILMHQFGVSLNLISLGGLALASGMNVDASVVVLENIFRHLSLTKAKLSYQERLDVIVAAVNEVRLPIILATLTSLLVFLPLTFTSDITYAILGDLAKAVIFSHGLSLIVALVLVPTVRLHLGGEALPHDDETNPSLRARFITQIEKTYIKLLSGFLKRERLAFWASTASFAACLALIIWVPTKLNREIVGKPQSNIIKVNVHSNENLELTQKIKLADKTLEEVTEVIGKDLKNTFGGVWSEGPTFNLYVILHDRSRVDAIWQALEKKFENREEAAYRLDAFVPSELPIPQFNDLTVSVKTEAHEEGALLASELLRRIKQERIYDQVNSSNQTSPEATVDMLPHRGRWRELQKTSPIQYSDLADISELATSSRYLGHIEDNLGDPSPMFISFGPKSITDEEELRGFPVGLGQEIVPLSALAELNVTSGIPSFTRENGRTIYTIDATLKKGTFDDPSYKDRIQSIVDEIKSKAKTEYDIKRPFSIAIEDSKKELTQAISELSLALFLSVVLIIIILSFEFSSWFDIVSILIALFFGVGGVFLSLYVFQSTLSLNSILGIILLNGISIGNSIILVDLIKKKRKDLAPVAAVLAAARDRIRPILMTSLTTILGMLPIALGYGEGGSVLKPLGIAVCGGMWISLVFTLFLVPYLQSASIFRKLKA